MNQEDLQKALDIVGKGGIIVNGDLVLEKHVENEIGNVEDGGIGIQIIGSKEPKLTVSDKEIKGAIEQLQNSKDDQGNFIMHDLDQWYAIFRVLSNYCGYPSKPKDFESTMKNIGSDNFRIPCKYENFRKVTLNKLPSNISLWKQYSNSADQYSMKQLKVALKLIEILHLE